MILQEKITSEDGIDISILVSTVANAKAQVIFAHGAGANMSHEFMDEISRQLNGSGINVIRFNFPFMDKSTLTGKRYPPDKMPKLLSCYQAVIGYVIEYLGTDLPLFLGGKSMGSRVAAMLVADATLLPANVFAKVSAVFCLGYPFHPTKKPEKLRLEPLFLAKKPLLIVQGERDTLGSKAEISDYQLPTHCQCVFLADGDHSFKPRVKSGFTYSAHMKSAVAEIVNFIDAQTVNTIVHK